MTGTNHGMTGAVIALYVSEPALAIVLSYFSHYACDALPHFGLKREELFGKNFNIILIADFMVAVTLMVVLSLMFPERRLVIWACMVAAASPDLAWAYYHLYAQRIKQRKLKLDIISRFHSWIQWSQTRAGALVEIIWFVLMGALILRK